MPAPKGRKEGYKTQSKVNLTYQSQKNWFLKYPQSSFQGYPEVYNIFLDDNQVEFQQNIFKYEVKQANVYKYFI